MTEPVTDPDIQCVTDEVIRDPAAACAADLESLTNLVDRIREVRAAFQAACDTFDPATLELWVSGASDEDARLFQLMLDFNARYQLQNLERAQTRKKEAVHA